MQEGKELVLNGEKNAQVVIDKITEIINSEPLAKIDYVQIASFPQIEPVKVIDCDILTAVAVYIGTTRLIDNFIIENGAEK